MNYIVLDLEWNQPVNEKNMVKTPILLYGEIIQIGAVKLDEDYHMLDTFKIMVTPTHYRKMHKKVAKLTKITTEDLQYGFPFPVAFKHFQKWCGEDFVFLTWGPDDIAVLNDNMVLHEMDPSWIPDTYNVQMIFDDQIAKERRQIALSSAMEKVGETALEAHDALHDARNTASVCVHLDMSKGLAEHEKLQQRSTCYRELHTESEKAMKTYTAKEEAFADPELVQFHCPKCGGTVTCGGIIKQNTAKSIAIGRCENGDELFVRFKFTRRGDGRLGVSRMIYEMDDNNRRYYLEKKAERSRRAFVLSAACRLGGEI